MRGWLTAVLAITTMAAQAQALEESRLETFLRAVEDEARLATALRADGELTVASPDGSKSHRIVFVYRPASPGTDLYIEVHGAGFKALILSNGERAFRLAPGGTKAEPFPNQDTVLDSEFTREDLEVFRRADFDDTRISDESGSRMTVSLAPKDSQYSLRVITFDTERKIPLKTLYYRGTLNNLVKMRRDEDHVLVGRRWLPRTITMEDFKLRTESTLKLRWSQDPALSPELFDPESLPRASLPR